MCSHLTGEKLKKEGIKSVCKREFLVANSSQDVLTPFRNSRNIKGNIFYILYNLNVKSAINMMCLETTLRQIGGFPPPDHRYSLS